MIHTKARIIALSSVVVAAIGCFIGVSTSSEHFTELTVATASTYTAEINTSTKIVSSQIKEFNATIWIPVTWEWILWSIYPKGCRLY